MFGVDEGRRKIRVHLVGVLAVRRRTWRKMAAMNTHAARKLMMEARRGVSLGRDVDMLVAMVIRIGEKNGYLSLKPGGNSMK